MKIYTRGGDDGTTGLFGGRRVAKCNLRVEAYGAVDEANSVVGLAVVAAVGHSEIREPLMRIQARMFDIGAHLATPPESDAAGRLVGVDDTAVAQLETWIDDATDRVAPLKNFVLPGGSELAARLHVARTACRRAERRCVDLAEHDEPVATEVIVYLNRLGDLLFAFARLANHLDGVDDVVWRGGEG